MIMSTEMNEDGTMAVMATYTSRAIVNVRNSASEDEINDAFNRASKLVAVGAIAELAGADMPAMTVDVPAEEPKPAARKRPAKPATSAAATVNSASNLAHLPRNLLG